MSFLSGIGNILKGVGHFLTGNNDDEERRRQQQAQQQQQTQTSYQAPQTAAPSQNTQQVDLPNTLAKAIQPPTTSPYQLIQSNKPATPAAPPVGGGQSEIDQLAAANLEKAKNDQHESWLSRNVTDRNWQKRAEALARDRAVTQYQDKYGYNQAPEVQNSLQKSHDQLAKVSEDNAEFGRGLDTVSRAATKAGQIAQYIPVTGAVMNLGLAGAERENFNGEGKDIANQRDKNEFGMTADDFNALPASVQAKLHNIRNIGYGLAPLDITGLGGLAKSEGVNLGKDAAIQLLKEGAVDEATKVALKSVGVDTAKNLVKSAAVGTGISMAGQKYLTGKVDPLGALKTGTMLAGTNELFNPTELTKASVAEVAPGIKSANPRQLADAVEQAAPDVASTAQGALAHTNADVGDINAPAFQRGVPQTVGEADAQHRLTGTTNLPDQTFSADARTANELPPDPLDVPTFLRKNAGQAKSDAVNDMSNLDSRISAIEGMTGTPVGNFKDKQAIAAAFAESPEKGQAMARYLAAKRDRLNPGDELTKAVGDRRVAGQDFEAARQAQEAQNALDNPVPTPEVVPSNPAEVAPPAPIVPPELATPPPAEAERAAEAIAPPVEPAVANPTGEVAPAASAVPTETPPTVPLRGDETRPAAPISHDQLVANLGPEVENAFKGKYSDVPKVSLDQLTEDAKGTIANMSDEDLVRAFQSTDPTDLVHDGPSLVLARAALDRLRGMKDDPVAIQTMTNIFDAMDKAKSKSGLILRVAQEEFDKMPIEMKVRYIVNKIDAANRDVKNYDSLKRDPAKLNEIETALNSRLQASQDVADRIAGLEAQANQAADAAKNGERVDTDLKGLAKEITREQTELERSNGELVKYFQDLVPGRTRAEKSLVDFPKRMMLFSGTGRINDIVTTGFNVAHHEFQNITQSLLAKAVNLVKPGTVTDTSKGLTKLPGGAFQGLKKSIGEVRGNQYVENLEKSLKGNEDLRSGLRKPGGPLGRTIQAGTELATNLTEGVKQERLVQLADQEARKFGLKGDLRKQYTQARAAAPSREMAAAADHLKMEMNNLNENPVTRALNRVSSGIEGKGVIGGIVKNQVLPFTSWLGGNIYNSVTDKNVIASTIKFGNAVRKGDAEGAVRNLAAGINGAAQAYGIGYQLAKTGVLTPKNAEGYNDGGLYIHAGDRYVSVGVLGFFAPNIILGNAAYQGLENNNGQSPATTIAKTVADTAWNSLNVGNALGTDTNINKAVQAKTRPGGDWTDAAAVATGGAAGQFIPGITGDANAVLDNGLKVDGKTIVPDSLNPTHEAANTKVENPNSPSGHAKDYVGSAEASLLNRIPGVSQQLPRKTDVAAKDLFDRTVKGDRDTSGSIKTREVAKTKADQAADWKKRDVPNFREKNFDDAVQARFEKGEYDKSIEALQAKLDDQRTNKDIPESKNKEIESKIKLYQVHKDGKFDPAMVDQYKGTSLSEWRDMGDPESDTYNPTAYEKLYKYDTALAKAGISGSSLSKDENKYTAKKPGKGRRGGSGSSGGTNTLGSINQLSKIDFGSLAPQKLTNAKIPVLQSVKPGELIKKRTISVGRAR